jgi:hypothetical protein
MVVGMWIWWEKKREKRYDREDSDLEKGSEDMERNVMATMRKRTMSKVSTWDTRVERKNSLARDEDNDFGAFKEPKPRKTNFGTLLTVPTIHF